MGKYNDINTIYMPILAIVVGTFLIYDGKILPGLFIHLGNLLAIIILIIFGELSIGTKNILQSLTLIPILQIIDLSMPQFFANIHSQYLLIYGVMLIPIYSIIKSQIVSKESKIPICEKCRNKIDDDAAYCPHCGIKIERQQYLRISIAILTMVIMTMIGQYISNIRAFSVIGGEFASIFLIILLSISFFLSDTKYWNRYTSNTLNICTNPLLLTFMSIVIFNIMVIV